MKLIKGLTTRAIGLILVFVLICGVLYTGIVTGAAQLIFPHTSNGSIIEVGGKAYGSELLGQKYMDKSHMWGRVMDIDTKTFVNDGKATMYAYPANMSVTSEEYGKLISDRVKKIRAAHPEKIGEEIPADLITASGSGLDPHISVEAAQFQAQRIADNNGMTVDRALEIIGRCTEKKFLGIMGQDRVNVLKVNLMLDGIIK